MLGKCLVALLHSKNLASQIPILFPTGSFVKAEVTRSILYKFQIKKESSINGRCSQLLLRATIVCFITFVIIGYSFALSRNFNLMNNPLYSEVPFVTNLLPPGKLHQNFSLSPVAMSKINQSFAPLWSKMRSIWQGKRFRSFNTLNKGSVD